MKNPAIAIICGREKRKKDAKCEDQADVNYTVAHSKKNPSFVSNFKLLL